MKRCLDENETAQCAEYFAGSDQPKPDESVLIHVQDCFHCKSSILETVEIILLLADLYDSSAALPQSCSPCCLMQCAFVSRSSFCAHSVFDAAD
ncbi:MAG: hypothetical protein HOD37_11710 [Bacteroidetes bacterium]|nr:hypothetical protein [Bacteroidota bacterium]